MKAIGTFTLYGYAYTVYRVTQKGCRYILVHRRKSPMDQGFSNIFNPKYVEMDDKALVEKIHQEEIKIRAEVAALMG